MPVIRVRAVEGRKPSDAPQGGVLISHSENGTVVRATGWINKLIAQGDVVLLKKKAPAPEAGSTK